MEGFWGNIFSLGHFLLGKSVACASRPST